MHPNDKVFIKELPYLKVGHEIYVILKGSSVSLPFTSKATILDDVRFIKKGHILEKSAM